MTYILSKDLPDAESLGYEKIQKEKWLAYQARLQKVKKNLPVSTQDYALAEWHYDFADHRCPHDAWLEHIRICEPATGERSEIRSLEIELRLLGAYHDGYIVFHYKNVESYYLDQRYRTGKWQSTEKGHGDWVVDEIDLSRNGFVLHEIEWLDGGHWIIECRELAYTWIPK